MKHAELIIGNCYVASVNGRETVVKLAAVTESRVLYNNDKRHRYQVLNLASGRSTIFRSAQKFKREATLGEGMDARARIDCPWKTVAQLSKATSNGLKPTIASRFHPQIITVPTYCTACLSRNLSIKIEQRKVIGAKCSVCSAWFTEQELQGER